MNKYFFIILLLFPVFINGQENQYIFEHLTTDDGLSRNSVSAIMQDKYGFMWFGTWNGLNKYDGHTFTVYKSNLKDSSSISNNRVNNIFKDSTGTMWIETIDGIFNRYNYHSDDFTRFEKENVPKDVFDTFEIIREVEEKPGIIWSYGNDQLIRENMNTGTTQVFTHDAFNDKGLNDNYITSIYLDNSLVLWIGTNSGGINKANLLKKKFFNVHHHPVNPNSLQSNIIRAIATDNDGNVWVGSRDKGLCRIELETNTYTRYYADQGSPRLSNNRIRELFVDSDGTLWIGASGSSPLMKYLPEQNIFKAYLGGPDGSDPPQRNIYSIYEDGEGYLWIGSFDGLTLFDKKTETFAKYRHDPIDHSTISHNYVRVIHEDAQGNIWVGTETGGLNKVVINEQDTVRKITFKRYLHEPGNLESLSDNRVYSICNDDNGTLWVGTAMGLDKFNPESETFTHYNQEDGLADVMIYGILKDKNNHLWLSHDHGISKFCADSSEIEFTNYFKADGLQGNEFSEDAYHLAPDGKMYFGGVNGLTYFYPDSIENNSITPEVIISDLKIFNNSVRPGEEVAGEVILEKPIYETNELHLSYKHHTLTFEFAALHYANPDNNKFEYKLIGFDDEWQQTGSEKRFATYSNLQKREYELLIKASNSDGIWNPEPERLLIYISPPFWRTTYFYVALVIVFILTIFGLIKMRERKLENDKKRLEKQIAKSKEEIELQKEEIVMQKNEIKLREKDEKDLRWLNEGLAKFGDIISENKNDIKQLTQHFLSNLVQYVEADQGGLFLLNDDNEEEPFLELAASYAFTKEKLKQIRIEIGEGQVGTCFKEGKHIEVKNLPEGYTKINSGLGEKSPKYLVLFPLRMDETILGVIELASLKKLKGIKLVFLEKISSNITSILATEKANQRALKMYNDSIAQTEELKLKEEELRQNLEEMEATQEELQRTNREAQKSMKELERAKQESDEQQQELIELAEKQAETEEELNLRIRNLEEENGKLRADIESLKK